MSERQWKVIDVVKRVESGLLTSRQGAQIAGVSTRQFLRIRGRVAVEGKKAVVPGWGAGATGRAARMQCGRGQTRITCTMPEPVRRANSCRQCDQNIHSDSIHRGWDRPVFSVSREKTFSHCKNAQVLTTRLEQVP